MRYNVNKLVGTVLTMLFCALGIVAWSTSTQAAPVAKQTKLVYEAYPKAHLTSGAPGVLGVCFFSYTPHHAQVGIHKHHTQIRMYFTGDCPVIYSWWLRPEAAIWTTGVEHDKQDMIITPRQLRNIDAGSHSMLMTVEWAANPPSVTANASRFTVQRNTIFTQYNCGPEPIKAGKALVCDGRLVVVSWDKLNPFYRSFRNRTIYLIDVDAAGGDPVDVDHTKTNSRGQFTTIARVFESAYWKVQYLAESNNYANAESRYDLVVVN